MTTITPNGDEATKRPPRLSAEERHRRNPTSPLDRLGPPLPWSEVTQTLMHDAERQATEGVFGNCMQAAVASVLNKPLDAVPHFSQFLWWPQAMELWARGHGLTMKSEVTAEIPDRLCVVGGTSPRGSKGGHAVVGYGRQVVWDPHPSRDGILAVTDVLWFETWATAGEVGCWMCRPTIWDGDEGEHCECFSCVDCPHDEPSYCNACRPGDNGQRIVPPKSDSNGSEATA